MLVLSGHLKLVYDTFGKEKDTILTLTSEAKQWLGQLDNSSLASTAEKGVCVDEEEEDEDTDAIEPLETVAGSKLANHVAKMAVIFNILVSILKCSLHSNGCVDVSLEIR